MMLRSAADAAKQGLPGKVLQKNHKTRPAVVARLPPVAQKGINYTVGSSLKRLKGNTVGEIQMKRMLVGAALLAAAPFCAQAQSPLQPGGFYIGVEGGANWMFNTSFTSTLTV